VASCVYVDHDERAQRNLYACLQRCSLIEELSPADQRIYSDNGYLGGIVHEMWRRAPFRALPLMQPDHNKIWGYRARDNVLLGCTALGKYLRVQGEEKILTLNPLHMKKKFKTNLASQDSLTDGLTDWLTDWLTVWLTDWFIH